MGVRLLPVGLLLVLLVPGCLGGGNGRPCSTPPDEARTWPDEYGLGITLATTQEEGLVRAWACNTSGDMRWTTVDEGSCVGPWSWVVYDGPSDSPYASGPGGHYGQCGLSRLAPDRGSTFQVDTSQARPGDRLILRFHVLLQPEMLTDAGGGPVTANLGL